MSLEVGKFTYSAGDKIIISMSSERHWCITVVAQFKNVFLV